MSNKFYATYELLGKFKKAVAKLNSNPLCIEPLNYTSSKVRLEIEDDVFEEVYEVIVENIDAQWLRNDYIFVARIEDGVIYKHPNCNIDVPQNVLVMINDDPTACHHCNVNRYRKNVYLIQNKHTSEFMLVGSSCIKDFLGHDPTKYLRDLENLFDIFESFGGRIKEPYYIGLSTVLAWTIHAVTYSGYGYVTKNSSTHNKPATADDVQFIISRLPEQRDDIAKDMFNGHSRPSKETYDLANKIVKELPNLLNTETEFGYNMYTIFNRGVCTYKEFGIVCYAYVVWKKEQEKTATFSGNINSFPKLDVTDNFTFIWDGNKPNEYQSQYGYSLLIKGFVTYNDIDYPVSFFLSNSRKNFVSEKEMILSGNSILIRGRVELQETYGLKFSKIMKVLIHE